MLKVPIDPAISHQKLLKELKTESKVCIHSGIIHNSQKVEDDHQQMST